MPESTPASWTCRSCGAPLRLAPGRAPVLRICDACGASHDLRAAPPVVVGTVDLDHHRPEGLVELGRRGRLGERNLQVVGRVRLGGLRGASFETFDDWELLAQDGVALRLRERQGHYAILLPVPEEQVPSSSDLHQAQPGTTFVLAGQSVTVEQRRDLRAVHLEGQLHHLVEPNAPVISLRAQGKQALFTVVVTGQVVLAFRVEPLEDRAMWAIFGYSDIMEAYDVLFQARQRAEGIADTVGHAAVALLVLCFLGALFVVFLTTSVRPMSEGWSKFEFSEGRVEQAALLQGVSLDADMGFYRIRGECGLDTGSRELSVDLVDEATSERVAGIIRCVQPDQRVGVAPLDRDFRWSGGGPYKIVATHTPAPGAKGRAHVSVRLTWHLANPWPPLLLLLLLLVLGLAGLGLWAVLRRAGLAPLEATFEERRAELVLALRRRRQLGAPNSSSSSSEAP